MILLVKGRPLGSKGVKKLYPLTLPYPRPTYRFYSVLRQTILLVKGRPLGSEGVKKLSPLTLPCLRPNPLAVKGLKNYLP